MIYRNGIGPKCAPDVIILNLADELSFCQKLFYPISFQSYDLKIQVLKTTWTPRPSRWVKTQNRVSLFRAKYVDKGIGQIWSGANFEHFKDKTAFHYATLTPKSRGGGGGGRGLRKILNLEPNTTPL